MLKNLNYERETVTIWDRSPISKKKKKCWEKIIENYEKTSKFYSSSWSFYALKLKELNYEFKM